MGISPDPVGETPILGSTPPIFPRPTPILGSKYLDGGGRKPSSSGAAIPGAKPWAYPGGIGPSCGIPAALKILPRVISPPLTSVGL